MHHSYNVQTEQAGTGFSACRQDLTGCVEPAFSSSVEMVSVWGSGVLASADSEGSATNALTHYEIEDPRSGVEAGSKKPRCLSSGAGASGGGSSDQVLAVAS